MIFPEYLEAEWTPGDIPAGTSELAPGPETAWQRLFWYRVFGLAQAPGLIGRCCASKRDVLILPIPMALILVIWVRII